MENVKKICKGIQSGLLFLVIFATLVLIILQPEVFFTNPWSVIHWYGLALLIYVIAKKIESYANVFINPQLALVTTIVQLAIAPIIIRYIVTYTQIPTVLATAIVLAALSPGITLKSFVSNISLSALMFLISIYVLPTTSSSVSNIYQTTTDSHTKYILVAIAFILFIIFEIKKRYDEMHNDDDYEEELVEVYRVVNK